MLDNFNPFRRRRPEGRFRLAHPLKEPARAVAQSFVVWPAAAIAAIMYAGHLSEEERTGILVFVLQVTVLYPLIAGACFVAWFLLARVGREHIAPLPLLLPLAIMAIWALVLVLFLLRYLASLIAHWVGVPGLS